MAFAAAFIVEREAASRRAIHPNGLAHFHFMEHRREPAPRNKLKEKLDLVLQRAGDNRVRAFDELLPFEQAQRGVLPGRKTQRFRWAHANSPQVESNVAAMDDFHLLIDVE